MNKALLNAISYARLYLEYRIMECKSAGESAEEYEQELAEIEEFLLDYLKEEK